MISQVKSWALLHTVQVKAMQVYDGSRGVALHTFITSALDVGGHLHDPATLSADKIPLYPLYRSQCTDVFCKKSRDVCPTEAGCIRLCIFRRHSVTY